MRSKTPRSTTKKETDPMVVDPPLLVSICKKRGPPRSAVSFDVGGKPLCFCRAQVSTPRILKKSESLPIHELFYTHLDSLVLGGKKTTIKVKTDTLIGELNKRPWLMDSDRIRIEQQPMFPGQKAMACFRNQVLSHVLYTYFRARGHPDVDFTHAVYKLQVLGPGFADGSGITGEKNYRNRKDLATTHAIMLLKDSVENRPILNKLLEEEERTGEGHNMADPILQTAHALYREK